MATLIRWMESGAIKKPSQLEPVTGRSAKKKQCTRADSTAAAVAAQQPLRPTVGIKEPRAELSRQQSVSSSSDHRLTAATPAALAESVHSSSSSGDNRSSDSDFNPTERKAKAAASRGRTASAERDTPSSQSGQEGDNEHDSSPEQTQKRQPKKAKTAVNAAPVSTQQAALFRAEVSTAVAESATLPAATPVAAPPPPLTVSLQRLPAGYLPSFDLTADGNVTFCVPGQQLAFSPAATLIVLSLPLYFSRILAVCCTWVAEYVEFIRAHSGVVARIKPTAYTPPKHLEVSHVHPLVHPN